MKFDELQIHDIICGNLNKAGIIEPTLIQEKSIPPALEGKDIVVESATGSGKTIAFGVPLMNMIASEKGKRGLVLAPTRELAEQIYQELKNLGKGIGISFAIVYGGVGYQKQIKDMGTADIIIATPGRMLDHMQSGNVDISDVGFFVLDEADRMLDMGFLPDVKRILSQIPADRQFLCYSATYIGAIKDLTKKLMKDPVHIKGEEMVDPKNLKQYYYDVNGRDKVSLLAHLLQEEDSDSVMVFCNSRRMVDDVVSGLKLAHINAIATHGGLTQQRRKKVLSDFHKKDLTVLVCTDVAARGLDINDVTHVYNFDIPDETKQYIHRIGRTARAGKKGVAINLLSARDHENFDRIIRFEDVSIESIDTPKFEKLNLPKRDGGPRQGGFGGNARGPPGRGAPRGGSGYGGNRGGSRPPSRGGSSYGGNRDGPRRDSPRGDSRGPSRDGPRSSGSYGGSRDGPSRDGPRSDSRPPSRDGPRGRPARGTRDDLKARGSRGEKTIHKATNPRGRSSDRRSGPRRVRE